VKELRPLVAKGVHVKWATTLLLSCYRRSRLDLLIESVEVKAGVGSSVNKCRLGTDVDESNFKRYTSAADVFNLVDKGLPVTILLYSSANNWNAGVVILLNKHWLVFP
jgi:hypothetical protein